MKEEVLRNTPIRTVHEVGEIKRAQEQRSDEVSVQKLRENHETIQQLTSQLQQMQEQMSSMNDSGDFQDVESNYSGRLSHVSSQLALANLFPTRPLASASASSVVHWSGDVHSRLLVSDSHDLDACTIYQPKSGHGVPCKKNCSKRAEHIYLNMKKLRVDA